MHLDVKLPCRAHCCAYLYCYLSGDVLVQFIAACMSLLSTTCLTCRENPARTENECLNIFHISSRMFSSLRKQFDDETRTKEEEEDGGIYKVDSSRF